jgi:aspartyl-tRNA synthetase
MAIKEKLSKREPISIVTPSNNGKAVLLCGFVKNVRIISKKLKFILLEDRTGDVQITFRANDIDSVTLQRIDKITPQSVICIEGTIQKSDICQRGVEVIAHEMDILSVSDVPLPLDITGETNPNLDTRLNWRFLDLRNKRNRTIILVLSDFIKYSREFFDREGFIEIFTPKFIGAPSESGAEVFEVEYFGRKVYLAQSPQFYKQMAISAGLEKVFEIGPVFRANPSFTSRHDTEFTSLDIEMAYIDSVEDIINFEEKWLIYVFKKLREKWNDVVSSEFGVEIKIPATPFPRLTMHEAYAIVKEKGIEVEEESDLGALGEKALGEYIQDTRGHEFVFITHFPWKIRPFYHMRPENSPNLTLSYDLLWKGLEITTGAQREHRYHILINQAKEKGLNLENIGFYLDFFRYGCPPHGGFGLSPTRFIMNLLNLKNVREATLLPRDPNRVYP